MIIKHVSRRQLEPVGDDSVWKVQKLTNDSEKQEEVPILKGGEVHGKQRDGIEKKSGNNNKDFPLFVMKTPLIENIDL